ncbi:transformer-2 protein homolog beta-like isoform X2 [Sardina pilchardus]|uniref:transformer-2 protein homolog beta-like isoform X2 n=1 Tax=Sardina pilchardus TaxID=27697 RepID=UPI002E1307EB
MSNRRRHIGNRAKPDPSCCLGVFGLSLYTTERDLREVFSKYGPLANAKERANGMELDGHRIRVDYSITKRPHTPTPGIYMDRATYGGGSSTSCRRDYYDRDYERGFDRGYDRYDDRDYYRSYRRRSSSPYYGRGAYRSRSRSYSPRHY